MRRHLPILLLLAACEGNKKIDVSGPASLSNGLHSFSTCDETLAYAKELADYQMTVQLEAQKRWVGDCNYYLAEAAADGRANDATAAPASPESSQSAPAYSETNNQVKGVDEADITKTIKREERLYNLSVTSPGYYYGGGSSETSGFIISQVFPVADAKKIARVDLPNQNPIEFLVAGNYAIVFSTNREEAYTRPGDYDFGRNSFDACYGCGSNAALITVIDISNLEAPSIVRQRSFEGSYLSSRRIGDAVRIITSASLHGPQLEYYPQEGERPLGNYCSGNLAAVAEWHAAYDRLIARNRQKIAASTIQDWLPRQREGEETSTLACEALLRPGEGSGLGITRVITATFSQGPAGQWHDVAVVADGNNVYASMDALFIGTNPYNAAYWAAISSFRSRAEDADSSWLARPKELTGLHRFDISDPTKTTYSGSGQVEGVLLNQFAMDEFAGHLRVATTTNRWRFWGRADTEKPNNHLFIMRTQDGSFELVGELRNLKEDESIFAARFVGNKGFIVTAKQIDPLFTFDLTNPAAPVQKAALEVPGISTYLHPMDDGHLLTIGRDSATGEGWLNNVKLSIYDVTDLSQPAESHKSLLTGDYVWSEAVNNHKAFTYFTTDVAGTQKNILAFPVNVYNYQQRCYDYNCYQDGLRVYEVSASGGFTELGDVYNNDLVTNSNRWGWQAVRRAIVMGQYVISMSDAGLKIADLAAFPTVAATVKF